VLSSRSRGARRLLTICLASVAPLLCAAPAAARNAYVANSGDGTVTVFDTRTNAVIGAIPVGLEPVDVAISPDGERAYVANRGDDTVTVIDTSSNAKLGSPVDVGDEPRGLAVTPNGAVLYVANAGDDTVSVISTAANAPIAAPIEVGDEPDGIAITPDGSTAFVAQRGGDLSVIDTATNAVVDSVADPLGPSRLAIGPRGGRGFVTNSGSSSVTAFNPINRSPVGAPIMSGAQPAGIAIDPGGAVAYAASPVDGTITPIDTSLDSVLSLPVGGFPGATGVAFDPRGLSGYVTDEGGGAATILDATRNVAAGSIGVGAAPAGVAVVPDQGPAASFFVSPTRRRAKKTLTFHAAGSTDSDGSIVNYAWDFGDGRHAEGSAPTRVHRYRRPGNYQVSLVVTDDEGCSTEFVYTGQTAYCNGSAAAALTTTMAVLSATGPKLRMRGSHRQRLGGALRVFAHCVGKACSFRAGGLVIASRESGGVVRRSRHRLSRAISASPSRGWRRLTLHLTRRTRRAAARALRSGGKAKARVTVLATDEGGDQTLGVRKIKLVRGG
jgi:YVTN family beta-propeller protein